MLWHARLDMPLRHATRLSKTRLLRGKGIQRVASLKRPTVKKRAKKSPERKLKEELWELCRKITEKRYPSVCFTCDKPISGTNRHLGHFIPRSVGGAALRYNLENLRWQCYYDNINLGGHGAEYYRRLVKEIGIERVEALFELKNHLGKTNKKFYEDLISDYRAILESHGETKERRA